MCRARPARSAWPSWSRRATDDAYQLMITGLVMVGGVVTNKSAVNLADTTPIATLTAEPEIIVVKADSKYGKLSDSSTTGRPTRARSSGVAVGGGPTRSWSA